MEGLLQLLQLQQVDKDLRGLEEAKDKYPVEINDRQSQLDKARGVMVEQEQELEGIARGQRQLERELEVARENLKQHEARFSEVKNNKEYDALQLEIEACKSRIAEHETQILEAIESTENLQEHVDLSKKDFAEVEQEQQSRIDELTEKMDSLQEEVDSVEKQRKKVAKAIATDLLTVYERSRKAKGLRIGAVRKGSCGVCFRQLPAQQKSNVRRGNEVIEYCESCGAILAWDEQSE